jgi:hypothetical protein
MSQVFKSVIGLLLFVILAAPGTVRADVLIVTAPNIVESGAGLSWGFLCVILFVFLLAIKFLIFYAFGSRRLVNYIYLAMVSVVSFLIWIFLLVSASDSMIFINFILAVLVGWLVEYWLLRLFLVSHYSKQSIFKFAVVSNIASIICQIIIFSVIIFQYAKTP